MFVVLLLVQVSHISVQAFAAGMSLEVFFGKLLKHTLPTNLVYVIALRPQGRLHFVGGVPNPIAIPVLLLLDGQKSISGSPVGSPNTIAQMLDFAAEHKIKPVVEVFNFERVNEALEKLRSGKVRYRLILNR